MFTFIIREEKTQVCTLVQIPVAKGKSSSDNILLEGLKQYQLNTSGEWEATETDWTWTAGKIYTVTELDTEAYYKGVSINNNTSMIYSFTYNAKADMYLTAINERQTWNILLSKTDADKKDVLLAGAVFGLYSPKEEEKISEKELAEWTFDAAPETTLVQNGVTYYLSKITKSESDGQIYWTTLNQDSYLIKELQAPKFYFGTDEVFTAIRSNATGDKMVYSMNVANEPGYQLPDSGGSGAEVYYMLGGLIMLFAAIYMMYSKNINKKHI